MSRKFPLTPSDRDGVGRRECSETPLDAMARGLEPGHDSQFALPTRVIRELDRITIEDLGIPGVVLMENAGIRSVEAALELIAKHGLEGVWVLCGSGNNAGDGLVVARHLRNRGVPVAVSAVRGFQALERSEDAATNLRAARSTRVSLIDAASLEPGARPPELPARILVVDALLGTGLAGEVKEPIAGWIRAVNAMGAPALALDVPSGLDSDTGRVLGAAVEACMTITFAAAKPGLFVADGPRHAGEVRVADISIPRWLIDRAHTDPSAISTRSALLGESHEHGLPPQEP